MIIFSKKKKSTKLTQYRRRITWHYLGAAMTGRGYNIIMITRGFTIYLYIVYSPKGRHWRNIFIYLYTLNIVLYELITIPRANYVPYYVEFVYDIC